MTTGDVALQSKVSGSSFYAGMRVLPRQEREAMYAIYAFCRDVDDIADDMGGSRPGRAEALARWRHDLGELYAGRPAGDAEFLRPAVQRFGLDRADFEAVIDGMAMDVERDIRFPDLVELELYCDRVASAVGRLSVRVFGMEEAPGLRLAHHLGRALQLTNILRDIDEDVLLGRVYLPREPMEREGIALGDYREAVLDPRIDIVCRELAMLADGHFAESRAILEARPAGHLIAPRLMAGAYAELLRRMMRVGWKAPRQRVRHNRIALLWMLLRLRLAR